MQRSGRPKQQFHAKQGSSELFSNRAGAAQQGSVPLPDDSQLAVRAYDEFPYDGYAFPLTHPERLGTLAILFGMHPEPAATARVLELGCGTGGNLIPMALSMPGATFTGCDLSGVQVQRERVTNLRHESLRVNDVERRILSLLDGLRGRQELIEQLIASFASVAAGDLSLKRGDAPITDPVDGIEQLGRFYDPLLPQFGKKALLVA